MGAASDNLDRRDTWVVIAAFNEGKVIRGVVTEVAAAGWSVVLVDDGSRDDTADAARVPGVVVLRHCVNLGQGAALQTGIEYALRKRAKQIVTFDADGQHCVEDIPEMVAALATNDIVLGSRFLGKDIQGATKRRKTFLKAATVMSNKMSGMELTDAHCGFRAFRATAAPKLRITQDRMAHASQLLHKIKSSGLRVTEVPVTVRYTEHSMRKGQSGFQAIRILFDYFVRPS